MTSPLITTTHTAEDLVDLPPVAEFAERDNEFVPFPELAELIHDMIEQLEQFAGLTQTRFVGLWRQEGGRKGGAANLGDISVATSREKLGTRTDLFVWVARDHAEATKLSWWHLEALTFSLLCRVTSHPERAAYSLVQPPVRAFVAELERYGAWTTTLQAARVALEQEAQLRMDFDGAGDQHDGDHRSPAAQVAYRAAELVNAPALESGDAASSDDASDDGGPIEGEVVPPQWGEGKPADCDCGPVHPTPRCPYHGRMGRRRQRRKDAEDGE